MKQTLSSVLEKVQRAPELFWTGYRRGKSLSLPGERILSTFRNSYGSNSLQCCISCRGYILLSKIRGWLWWVWNHMRAVIKYYNAFAYRIWRKSWMISARIEGVPRFGTGYLPNTNHVLSLSCLAQFEMMFHYRTYCILEFGDKHIFRSISSSPNYLTEFMKPGVVDLR
jgi:hypothetical protein